MKKALVFTLLALLSFAGIIYTSCKKDPCKGVSCQNGGTCSGGTCICPDGYVGSNCENKATTKISFHNNTRTTVYILADKAIKAVAPDSTIIYAGTYGDALTGTANTHGIDLSTSATVGEEVKWDINETFPAYGTKDHEFNVPSSMFFLRIQNLGTTSIRKVYVNYGLASQTLDNITIPGGIEIHNIGYYKAFPNSNVRMESLTDTQTVSSLSLDFTQNQYAFIYFY